LKNLDSSLDPPDERDQDQALILQAQAGDREAFGQLYSRHVAEVRAFVGSRAPDPATADDITSATWEAAWTSIGRFANGRPFAPWVMGIARYQILAAVARDRQHQSLDEEGLDGERRIEVTAPEAAPEQEALGRQRLEHAMRALDALPPRRRTALVLQVRDGMSEAAIASEMGTTTKAVHSLLHRARQQLREGRPAPRPRSATPPARAGGGRRQGSRQDGHEQAKLSQLWTEVIDTIVEIERAVASKAASGGPEG
jgi:RNA polymerase sigma-70 factor (ECF subfamily)